MAHTLVKILVNDDGDKDESPVWHYALNHHTGRMTLCTGEYYGVGESRCVFETKTVERGVPCGECSRMIKHFKAVKL